MNFKQISQLKKIIQEELQKVLEKSDPLFGPKDAVKGVEVLNKFPFSKLPETRNDVDWKNRGVLGWGDVYLPAVDTNGMSQILAKDDILGNQGYIESFKARYGEEPLFVINPASGAWYSKITVINPAYVKAKEAFDSGVQSFGTEGD